MFHETQNVGGLYLELTVLCERRDLSFYVQHRFAGGLYLKLEATFADGLYLTRRGTVQGGGL